MDEPKIFEVTSNFIDCFVCAKDIDHAKDVVHQHIEESFDSIEFFSIGLIPAYSYHNFTMEREGEGGTEMVDFNAYINEVRGVDDWEVVCTMDAR